MGASRESVRADHDTHHRDIMALLSQRIGPQRFNAWFRQGTRVDLEETHVKVSVPNPFVANWIETHYQAEISQAAHETTGKKRPVIVTIDAGLSGEIRKTVLDTQATLVSRAQQGRQRPRKSAKVPAMRHQLSDFVVGQSNRLAYSAAASVAAAQATPPFNPLFIHGPCGVGKTHLLQAICNAVGKVRRNGRALAWRYVTGEQFTNEFIQAIRSKNVAEFRGRYRKLDLLAIDDVHFLAAKKATQDEFLHTFNTIESASSQIVMASDAHPHLVGQLNAQLVSRFVAGMVVKIDTPDKDTRVRILARKAQQMKLKVSAEVLEFVATHIRGSVRELEGSLVKLAALAALAGKSVSLALATEALSDTLARTGSALTLGDIESAVAAYFGITPADIHSSRRTRTVSVARMVAMLLCRRHTAMSYPEIGRATGKHHSSVVLAVQRLEGLIESGDQVLWDTPAGRRAMCAGELVELLSKQFS